MRFSCKKIALILGESQTKTRRWVKEFLEPDSEKGFRSGKTRRHSLNDVFFVFLGGYLVNGVGFSVSDSKIIIADLGRWLEVEGLVPEKTPKFSPKAKHGKRIERYDIHIMVTEAPRAFCYDCRGIIRESIGKDGVVKSEYTTNFFLGSLIVRMNPLVDHVRILPISSVLQRFKTTLSFGLRP
jgi:hypothetical protein